MSQKILNVKLNPLTIKFDKLSKLRDLTDLFHKKTCKSNHTDMCSYFYEKWENPGYSKLKDFDKVSLMVEEIGFESTEKIINIL